MKRRLSCLVFSSFFLCGALTQGCAANTELDNKGEGEKAVQVLYGAGPLSIAAAITGAVIIYHYGGQALFTYPKTSEPLPAGVVGGRTIDKGIEHIDKAEYATIISTILGTNKHKGPFRLYRIEAGKAGWGTRVKNTPSYLYFWDCILAIPPLVPHKCFDKVPTIPAANISIYMDTLTRNSLLDGACICAGTPPRDAAFNAP